jgi:sugar/nucleoside kinase (ribokinase family)
MIDVLVLGQIIFDVSLGDFSVEMTKRLRTELPRAVGLSGGGDAQNAAITLGYLGVKTWLSGRVGDDLAGRCCISMLEASGVNCSKLIRVPGGGTATCINVVQEGGEAFHLCYTGENARYCNADIPFDLFNRARFVSLHSLFALPALDVAEIFSKARRAGAKTFADTTTVRGFEKIEMLEDIFPVLDIFAPSYDEAYKLLKIEDPKEMAGNFISRGVSLVVIKLGKKGCLVADKNSIIQVPAYDGPVVNATGAGDNFTAGFLYGLCKGYSREGAAKCGNAAGAITVGALPSTGNIKSERQLLDFIAARNDSVS